MQVSAWSNGGGTYGIRVGIRNRERFFPASWTRIEVEIEGRFYVFRLTAGFRNRCPEFRDRGTPVVREWLRQHRTLDWPSGDPPRMELIPLEGNRFQLVG